MAEPRISNAEEAVVPFRVDVPKSDLDDLRERLARTRWPQELPNSGWDAGVPQSYLRDLAEYWAIDYDWASQQERLNQTPQFTTVIDGQPVYFIHLRSPESDALPLLLTHGWPGSVVEFLRLLAPLADPRAHGGDPSSAFHVVVPALPGFGFSGPTTESGWGTARIAAAWAELMRGLGYARYGAHGGDFGAAVSRELGLLEPDRVVGVHLTELLSASASAKSADYSDDAERRSVEAGFRYEYQLSGYMWVQMQRPQTVATALADSPVGQLAWIVEKFKDWADSAQTPEDVTDRDTLLTNVMLYWLTGTAASSARIYQEGGESWRQDERVGTVPTALAVLPGNISIPVRTLVEKTENLVRWTEFPRGGHFPALEVPDLLHQPLRRVRKWLPPGLALPSSSLDCRIDMLRPGISSKSTGPPTTRLGLEGDSGAEARLERPRICSRARTVLRDERRAMPRKTSRIHASGDLVRATIRPEMPVVLAEQRR